MAPLHARPSFYLVLLFGLIFGLNIIPAFAPPTWMAVAFIGFEFPGTNTVLLALVAATAATLGRITLAKLSHWLVREKLLSDAHRKNIDCSVFIDEKKLSIAALSQTLPDRLIEQSMPWSAIKVRNCSLVYWLP